MKKSYVRVKVSLAMLVYIPGVIYAWLWLPLEWTEQSLEQMSSTQIGVLAITIAAFFYLWNVECEQCKAVWHKTGSVTKQNATSLLDSVFRRLAENDYWPHKKCRICGLERY